MLKAQTLVPASQMQSFAPVASNKLHRVVQNISFLLLDSMAGFAKSVKGGPH